MYIVKISPKGDLLKSVLMDKKKRDGYQFTPDHDMIPVGENKLAFYMNKGVGLSRKAKIGMVTINNYNK